MPNLTHEQIDALLVDIRNTNKYFEAIQNGWTPDSEGDSIPDGSDDQGYDL